MKTYSPLFPDFVDGFSGSFAVFGVSSLFVISRSSVRSRRVASMKSRVFSSASFCNSWMVPIWCLSRLETVSRILLQSRGNDTYVQALGISMGVFEEHAFGYYRGNDRSTPSCVRRATRSALYPSNDERIRSLCSPRNGASRSSRPGKDEKRKGKPGI
jgi:hypothetical protein